MTEPDTALQFIDQDIWGLNSSFIVWGCRGSVRMTVIRTPNGVLIHSPVALAAHHVANINALGRVTAILAPNLYHHMFLRDAMAAFPEARVLVPPGLEAKIGPLPRAETMSSDRDPGFPPEIDRFTFIGHDIQETILFHRPTRTLVTADLIYNYQGEHFPVEKAFFRAIGCYGNPKVAFYHRFAIREKAQVRRLIEAVRAWAPKRIVMCHGRIIESENAAQIFAEAWRRFV